MKPVVSVAWRQVAAGTGLALVVAAVFPQVVASALGVAAGAFLASRLAGSAGLLQGSVVATFFVVASTLLGLPVVPVDLAPLVLFDTACLAAGAAAGWLATRS